MNAELAIDITEQAHDEIHLPPCSRIDTEHQASVAKVIATLKNGHLNLPALPDMARKFQDLNDDPNASMDRVINLLTFAPVASMYIIGAANSAAKPKGNPVNDLPGITKLLQTNDGQDTPSAKPTNDKNDDSNCHLRSTCKMPEAYCKIGRCADWFF